MGGSMGGWVANAPFAVMAAVLGLVLGSFSTACVHRYLEGLTLLNPRRSICPKCQAQLRWYDNIPLLGYLLLGGRCRFCREPIHPRYPAMEALYGLWGLGLALVYGPGLAFAVHMFFGGLFLVASFIDLDSYILPDILTLPGAVLALAAGSLALGLGWQESFLGAGIGAGMFLAVQRLYRGLRGQEGLGTGDVKLMLSIGALGGPMALPLVLTVGATSALAASLFYVLRPGSKGMQTRIPFGPFLCLGSMVNTLFGKAFWTWYLQ